MDVDAVGEFCFLEDSQVHIGLVHPSKHQLQTSVYSIMNVVGSEPNRHPPPRRSPSTLTHTLPTYVFSPSLLRCPSRSRQPPPSYITGPVPPIPDVPFCSHPHSRPRYPLSSLLCVVHLGMGYSIAP